MILYTMVTYTLHIILYTFDALHFMYDNIELITCTRARFQDRDVVGGCPTLATAPDHTAPFTTIASLTYSAHGTLG